MKALLLTLGLVVGLGGCTNKNDRGTQVKLNKDSVQTGASIDVERYKYEDRKEFQNFISARLDAIDRGLDSLSKNAGLGTIDGSGTNSASKPTENVVSMRKNRISQIEKQRDDLSDRIGQISDADREQWDYIKQTFRNELVQIENSYQNLLTAQK